MREFPLAAVPKVSAAEMREIDRIMVEDHHIHLVQMMENAGRSLAELTLARFAPDRVVVLAGSGGNGGGGMVGARHLANRGARVEVVLDRPAAELASVPAHQADILERMGVALASEPCEADLVIDALIGYGLHGDPGGRTATLIQWANSQQCPVLALDVPSGVDATTGEPGRPSVRAAATVTLALPKTGLRNSPEVGELYLADISVPAAAYRALGLEVPVLFGDGGIVRLLRLADPT